MLIELNPAEIAAIAIALTDRAAALEKDADKWQRQGNPETARKLRATAIEYNAIVTGIRMQINDAHARARA